ncbi:testis-specific expressed protein 55 isoform X2 [Eublepharis macularius]|uniref:Testis-specific expressed protein 55 isoform X2 n=1 Tax=Eublepharis macularius TaxID=481883 RepID=A0AA97J226_EUBMA|nr:testis-specific expressed protein 55 isoform X2 [Eublepharis macularius]
MGDETRLGPEMAGRGQLREQGSLEGQLLSRRVLITEVQADSESPASTFESFEATSQTLVELPMDEPVEDTDSATKNETEPPASKLPNVLETHTELLVQSKTEFQNVLPVSQATTVRSAHTVEVVEESELHATLDQASEPQATLDQASELQATPDQASEPQATLDQASEPQVTLDQASEPQTTTLTVQFLEDEELMPEVYQDPFEVSLRTSQKTWCMRSQKIPYSSC